MVAPSVIGGAKRAGPHHLGCCPLGPSINSSPGYQQWSTKAPPHYRLPHVFCAVYRISITACHLPGVQNALPMHFPTIIQKDVLCSQFLSITTTNSGPTATADVQQGALWAALKWTRLFILSLPWNVHRCFHTRIVLLCPALLHELLQQI